MAVVLGVASGVYIFKPLFQQSPDTTADVRVTSVSQGSNSADNSNSKDL